MTQLVEQLIALDEGTLTEEGHLALFQHLVDTGLAWQLQGRIGREAASLIEAGLITAQVPSSKES